MDQLQQTARQLLPAQAQDDQDMVAGLPHPRTSVCGALAGDSAVVGADGLEYMCGLQVGEQHRAVGRFAHCFHWSIGPTTSFPTGAGGRRSTQRARRPAHDARSSLCVGRVPEAASRRERHRRRRALLGDELTQNDRLWSWPRTGRAAGVQRGRPVSAVARFMTWPVRHDNELSVTTGREASLVFRCPVGLWHTIRASAADLADGS
jgi:hypothetical protein